MKIHDCEQRSDEWRALRLGKLTGSRAGDAVDFRKDGKEGAARRDYRIELVAERLTGQACESDYLGPDMVRGIELEPEAIALYEVQTGQLVAPVGYLEHDTEPAGVSPDGVVDGFAGLVEVKCPRPATHLKYLRSGAVPFEYAAQIAHALVISGAQWCDFISYSPVFPEDLRLFVCRVNRDEAALSAYWEQARKFLAEVDAEIKSLEALRLSRSAA